jgi:hypothetical protein
LPSSFQNDCSPKWWKRNPVANHKIRITITVGNQLVCLVAFELPLTKFTSRLYSACAVYCKEAQFSIEMRAVSPGEAAG